MQFISNLIEDTLHLFYPHQCTGCGSDLLSPKSLLCINCVRELPHTHFADYKDNYVENIFRGRINIKAAHSEFYFSKGQLVQCLIHELKYRANFPIGMYLGELMGNTLIKCSRFSNLDYLIPLPLFPDKETIRGYNQAMIICNGLSPVLNIPVLAGNVIRQRATETQTRKHRGERWHNVEGSFAVKDPGLLTGKNILLIDDVITTGASLEACSQSILQIPGTTINIATLAFASK